MTETSTPATSTRLWIYQCPLKLLVLNRSKLSINRGQVWVHRCLLHLPLFLVIPINACAHLTANAGEVWVWEVCEVGWEAGYGKEGNTNSKRARFYLVVPYILALFTVIDMPVNATVSYSNIDTANSSCVRPKKAIFTSSPNLSEKTANSPLTLRCPFHLRTGCKICVEAKQNFSVEGATGKGKARERSASVLLHQCRPLPLLPGHPLPLPTPLPTQILPPPPQWALSQMAAASPGSEAPPPQAAIASAKTKTSSSPPPMRASYTCRTHCGG
ncbi:hypothetical protein BDP27DRAFT_1372423 [Rhodocollybia butyracea]|uniref:Uncharacterized protein n=1 Tax=Rhodocollybia butyracea TaxID=206335 RepID=A0A9P5TXA9_9AGAR|nr:hypothetical protein BDP27DRAFT_1372423 [Rhodocollybia butyracea]